MDASWDVRGYVELHIELRGLEKDRYGVHMHFRNEELHDEVFAFPESLDRVEQTLASVWNASDQRPVRKGSMDGLDPVAELGTKLYTALFKGPREAFFRRSQAKASEEGYGLRLLLSISDQEAAVLPWEFLYDGRDFLSLSTRSPVVRCVAQAQDPLPSPQIGLRILAATADQEFSKGRWKEMTRALYDKLAHEVDPPKVTIIEDATLSRLGGALSAAAYDVVHLCGHADKVLPGVQGFFLLDEKGRPAVVLPDQLAEILKPAKELKLVCLDACYSDVLAYDLARITRVPAVYGIRSVISDESADYFIHRFLAALLSGQTLTTAATRGRQAIDSERPGSREWGLPVLYTGSPDSQLTLGSWQTVTSASSREVSKGIDVGGAGSSRSAAAGTSSRERHKLEIWITLKQKNLEALEAQLANSNYPPPEVQTQAAGLREEIAVLETQLAQTA